MGFAPALSGASLPGSQRRSQRHWRRSAHLRSPALLLFLIAILISSVTGQASAQPPALTARYAISDVASNENEVSLILTIGLRNDSDQQLLNARLTLENADVPEENFDVDPDLVFGAFEIFDLDARGSAHVSRTFVLPALEYDRWQQGNHPCVRLVFDDVESGTTRRLTLPLVYVNRVPDSPLAF